MQEAFLVLEKSRSIAVAAFLVLEKSRSIAVAAFLVLSPKRIGNLGVVFHKI
jgi:hypothetical protein